MRTTTALRTTILAACCGLAASAISLADPPPPPPAPPEELLRGPAINDRDVPGATGTFSEPTDRAGKRAAGAKGDPRIRHRAFMDALRSLEGEEVAPDLKLTTDQRTKIDAIDAELRAALESFKSTHQADIDALREKVGEVRGKGANKRAGNGKGRTRADRADAPTPADAEMTDDSTRDADIAAAREQLKALRANAPKPEDFHTRIWAVLSAPQQALVQSRLDSPASPLGGEAGRPRPGEGFSPPDRDRNRDRASAPSPLEGEGGRPRPGEGFSPPDRNRDRDRARDRDRDRTSAASPLGGEAGPPQADRVRGSSPPADPARFDRLMERFHALPPEAQSRIIERIEEMLSRMENRRGPRPAPSMDDVDVPPPPTDSL
jgi:hypothetical protein